MQTAVEWLIEQLQAPCRGIPSHIIEQAKQMEKEQIINAFDEGLDDRFYGFSDRSEQYYNETYGSKDIALQNQLESKVITELSDEEIEKILFHHSNEYAYGFKDAIKWYREQLKSRQ